MNMEHKKYLIEEAVKLGMDKYSTYLLAECTDTEIEEIENDKDFQSKLDILILIEERELLQSHNDAIKHAIQKGNSRPIEWRLSKLNPEKWGDKITNVNKNVNRNINTNKEGNFTDEELKRIKKELEIIYGGIK